MELITPRLWRFDTSWQAKGVFECCQPSQMWGCRALDVGALLPPPPASPYSQMMPWGRRAPNVDGEFVSRPLCMTFVARAGVLCFHLGVQAVPHQLSLGLSKCIVGEGAALWADHMETHGI